MFDNGKMLSDYFDGVYDEYFDKLFSVNGCDFDPKKRKVYYFTVLYEYYGETFSTSIPDKLREVL